MSRVRIPSLAPFFPEKSCNHLVAKGAFQPTSANFSQLAPFPDAFCVAACDCQSTRHHAADTRQSLNSRVGKSTNDLFRVGRWRNGPLLRTEAQPSSPRSMSTSRPGSPTGQDVATLINEGDATAGLIRSVEQLVLGEKLFAVSLSPPRQRKCPRSWKLQFIKRASVKVHGSSLNAPCRWPFANRARFGKAGRPPAPALNRWRFNPSRAWKGKKFFGWFSSRRFASSGLTLTSAVAPHKNAENAWNQLCIRTH
jgi:hypothetical protein